MGLLCAFAAPRACGWVSTAARPELLAARGLLAGWIVVFCGSRALWLARRGIAVAVASTDVNPASVVEAADKALYRAKALGRDRVAVAGRGDPAAGRILSGAELTALTGEGNGTEDPGSRVVTPADR